MKIIIALCGLVAMTWAEIATLNKYEPHHLEHGKSVTAAKHSLNDRIAKLEENTGYNTYSSGVQGQYGNAYGASGSEKYVSCAYCVGGSENQVSSYNSRHSSSSQRSSSSAGHGLSSSDYAGSGIISRADDADDDTQSFVKPTYIGSSSRYSSNAHEAEDMQQRVVPHDLSSVSSSAYRSSVAQRDENELQRTIGGSTPYRTLGQRQSDHEDDDVQRSVGSSGYIGGGSLNQRESGSLRTYQQRQDDAVDEDDDVQRSVGSSGYIGGSHSQTRGSTASDSSSTRTASVVPVYTSGSHQRTSSSQSESEHTASTRPVPTGQYVSMNVRPGTSTVLQVPIRVIQTGGVQSTDDRYQTSRTSDYPSGSGSSNSAIQHPTSSTYRVVYTPSRNYVTADKMYSSSDSQGSRTSGVQQPEKLTNYNSFQNVDSVTQNRFHADESDTHNSQVRVAPVSVTYPLYGGSSRVASAGTATGTSGSNYNYNQNSRPSSTIESSSSSRTAEEREQRRYNSAAPSYISPSRISSDRDESRNQVSGGTTSNSYVVPVSGSQTRYQTNNQQQSGSGSQHQYQQRPASPIYGGNFSPYGPGRTQTVVGSTASSSDRATTRFGTGTGGGRTDDLHSYMSESERLARLQQQQIAGSSSGISLSNLDANQRTLQAASHLDSTAANFVRNSNLANRNSELDTTSYDGAGTGNGNGYTRVMSWNKQSKWASGSEHGTDGKPKSYSSLSTAESENHNINGAETGYKASTTTLENDGKVSTYTIHTP